MRTLLKHWWKAIFIYPQKNITFDSRSYDEYWESRGRKEVCISPWQKERTDIALSLMQEKKDAHFSVLDIGAGDGAVLQYIRSRHPNIEGIGIDFSESVLTKLRDAHFQTREIDLSNPSVAEFPSADYGILFEIIEHVRDSEILVQKTLMSVRKGVFISIPNSGFFTYRLRLLFGKFPAQWIVHPNEHLRFWTLGDVKWWLRSLSLENCTRIKTYQGVPLLKNIFPSLFAAGIVMYITHE